MPYRESWGYGQFVFWKKCFCETPYFPWFWTIGQMDLMDRRGLMGIFRPVVYGTVQSSVLYKDMGPLVLVVGFWIVHTEHSRVALGITTLKNDDCFSQVY